MNFRSTLLSISLPFLLAPTAVAQWDSIPRDPAEPVIVEGFLAMHDPGTGHHVFSAAAQKWTNVAPSSAVVLGTGDWTVLFREGAQVRGYSARRNASALLPIQTLHLALVSDDVALVVATDAGGTIRAHGYSAVTNAWTSVVLATIPAAVDVAISRFVIGIRDDVLVHGFAARNGGWSTFSAPAPPEPPIADGNVVLVDLRNQATGSGPLQLAAFSGVRGFWSTSPVYHSSHVVLLDHNVAYTRIGSALTGLVRGAGYSAYNATWTTSSTLHSIPNLLGEDVRDNVIRIWDNDPNVRLEGFGSRPGNWSVLAGNYSPLSLDADLILAATQPNTDLAGFSGVCSNIWAHRPLSSPLVYIPGKAHIGLVREGTTVMHAFRPASNTWVAPTTFASGGTVTSNDSLVTIRDTGWQACGTRGGTWVPGPPAPTELFSTAAGGSVLAFQQVTGAGAGDVYLFDERCNQWNPVFHVPPILNMAAGRNLVMLYSGSFSGVVWAYSVQRGDWTNPGPVTTPLAAAPIVEENVACFEDGSGQLYAFGSPNEGHVYYAWPNGTEYHVSGTFPGTSLAPILGYSIRGQAGNDVVSAYAAVGNSCPGIPLGGIGGLYCLDLATSFFLAGFGLVDADCVREKILPIAGSLPNCIELWLQPLVFDLTSGTLRWGERCDAAWFF